VSLTAFRLRLVAVALGTAFVTFPPHPLASQDPQQPRPVFRTGANVVRVDVTVTTRKGEPATTLTREDFELTEDGSPQVIDSFQFVRSDGTPTDDRSLDIRSREHAAAEAARDDVRLFLIFWDEYHIGQFMPALRGREVLTDFVRTAFGPTDLVGIMDQLTTLDSIRFTREPLRALARDRGERRPLRLEGAQNLLWLGGVVLAVALLDAPWREAAMVGLAALSWWRTPRALRAANGFTTYPIVEVAVLFFGIFLTMVPALELLRTRGGELGVRAPWQFFWAAGSLSSFLDNAPTYLTFLALGQGLRLPDEVVGVTHAVLAAISVGAVFMGANTYIGNAPNFMVKSIAEETGVRMPSFFGYMLYSGLILLPLFAVVTFVFFRPP